MRYYLYNYRTKSALWFSSRWELHRWIKSHFRIMSYKQMCVWSVHRDVGYTKDNPSSVCACYCYGNPFIDQLPDYIMSFLKS